MIVGLDEVGRGSWAGPICVAAVAWPNKARVKLLNDSKKVLKTKRAVVAQAVKLKALDIGIGWAAPGLIDKIGVTAALKYAAEQAVALLSVDFKVLIIDGNLKLIADTRAITQIKADASVPAVMAASIVAKVARDNYMQALGGKYLKYQFASHVGYGTKLHRSLLSLHGPCDIHRFSYSPLKAFIV